MTKVVQMPAHNEVLQQCEYRHRIVGEELDKILDVLNGDGKEGLVARMTALEHDMTSVSQTLQHAAGVMDVFSKRLQTIMIIMVLLAVASGGTLITKIIEIAIKGTI